MYVEACQRLSQRNCERSCLNYQLKTLGDALGTQKPETVNTDDVVLEGLSDSFYWFRTRALPSSSLLYVDADGLDTAFSLAPAMAENRIKVCNIRS
jgi:hypothetical protein